MNIDGEWREIPGFPGYFVNEHGTVASSWFRDRRALLLHPDSTASEPNGRVILVNRWMSSSHGYPMVRLNDESGATRNRTVHSLVAEAFLGAPPAGAYVAHFDGNKMNPHVSNLRWATPSENSYDKIRHGTHQRGEKHNFAKLSDADVREIRQLYATGNHYQRELAERFGVRQTTIAGVVSGKRKSWLEGPLAKVGPGARRRGICREPKASAWPRKMTAERAREIRELYATGEWTHETLGKRFGVNRGVILCITTGRTFKNAGGPLTRLDNLRGLQGQPQKRSISPEQARELRELYATGQWTHAKLGEKFGVSRRVALSIATGQSFKDAGGPITRFGLGQRKRRLHGGGQPSEEASGPARPVADARRA